MTTDIQPLDRTLGTFLANTEYGIWRHRRPHDPGFSFGHVLLPGMTCDEFTTAHRKERIVAKLENLSYLGLVNSHLFPHYDEYEDAISVYLDIISDTMWSDPIMIPKSRASPEGGRYLKAEINLPADLFDDIPDKFFDRFECRALVINTVRYEDMFWQNLEICFGRKETLLSWDGERFGKISGNVTVVVSDRAGTCKGAIIPAMMSVLLQAWTECCCLHNNPSYRWSGTALGRGRYRKNIDDLMDGNSNSCLKDMGLLLKGIQDASLLVSKPEEISSTDEKPEYSSLPPISAVERMTDILKESAGYRRLLELEELLKRVSDSLDGQDSKAVCEIWNRCVKQKVRSVNEIRALLVSKYLGTRNGILTVLSMSPVYQINVSCKERFWELYTS